MTHVTAPKIESPRGPRRENYGTETIQVPCKKSGAQKKTQNNCCESANRGSNFPSFDALVGRVGISKGMSFCTMTLESMGQTRGSCHQRKFRSNIMHLNIAYRICCCSRVRRVAAYQQSHTSVEAHPPDNIWTPLTRLWHGKQLRGDTEGGRKRTRQWGEEDCHSS